MYARVFQLTVLLLAGCAAKPAAMSIAADHPANPNAPEAPLPMSSRAQSDQATSESPAASTASASASMPAGHQHMGHPMAATDHDMGAMHHDMTMEHPTPSTQPGENVSPSAPRATPTTVPATTQAATKYTCTMHPEVISDKPGNCPKCGMKLVPVAPTTGGAHADHGGHP